MGVRQKISTIAFIQAMQKLSAQSAREQLINKLQNDIEERNRSEDTSERTSEVQLGSEDKTLEPQNEIQQGEGSVASTSDEPVVESKSQASIQANPTDKTESASNDPLAAFKETVFGEDFNDFLNPTPEVILKAVEDGKIQPDQTPFNIFLQSLSGYMRDTGAKGKIVIEYDAEGKTTFELQHSVKTPNLLGILELLQTKGTDVDVLSRESGRRLVDIMAKHTIYTLKKEGLVKEGQPIDKRVLGKILNKVLVQRGIETKQNAGVIFEANPEESRQDLEVFRKSLTMADQVFFGKIFASGKCRRPAVFEKVIEQIIGSVGGQ